MPALLRALRSTFSLSDVNYGNPELLEVFGISPATSSGVAVSETSALRHMAVWRAQNLEASTVASLPLKVWRDTLTGRVERPAQLFVDPMNAELDITWFEGLEYLVRTYRSNGNAYALKVRNELGDQVVRLVPLAPSQVRVFREMGRKAFVVDGIDEPLTAAEVLHIPGFSLDGVVGVSPIMVARHAIGIGIAGEEVAGKLFDTGLLNGGFLQAEGPIDEKQADEAKRRWRSKIGGLVRSYEVAVLSHGFKFQPATIPPKDAQWLEARQFSVAEIARLYGMPPALLFEYAATGNVESDKLMNLWLRLGLNQTLVRFEKRMSLHLLPRGSFCEFERGGLLQGTPTEQATVEQIQIASGVLTVDEARALHNRPPLGPPPAPPAPAAGPEPEEEMP